MGRIILVQKRPSYVYIDDKRFKKLPKEAQQAILDFDLEEVARYLKQGDYYTSKFDVIVQFSDGETKEIKKEPEE